jgi:hypothetical protein
VRCACLPACVWCEFHGPRLRVPGPIIQHTSGFPMIISSFSPPPPPRAAAPDLLSSPNRQAAYQGISSFYTRTISVGYRSLPFTQRWRVFCALFDRSATDGAMEAWNLELDGGAPSHGKGTYSSMCFGCSCLKFTELEKLFRNQELHMLCTPRMKLQSTPSSVHLERSAE